jgi:hypothetical protein
MLWPTRQQRQLPRLPCKQPKALLLPGVSLLLLLLLLLGRELERARRWRLLRHRCLPPRPLHLCRPAQLLRSHRRLLRLLLRLLRPLVTVRTSRLAP